MTKKPIAIVIVDTLQHVLAYNALAHSLKEFDAAQTLIFSDNDSAWGGLPVIPIPPIQSLSEYNRIITKNLAEHLKAEFCLVIQYDGFIVNPDQFSPHFYFYDYIGAPWPHFETMNVGNGGFSWRSRKLVDAVASLDYDALSIAEDLFICRQERPNLEKSFGIKFAPTAIASHFSCESVSVPFPTFGFHGIFHLPDVYRHSIDFLVENINSSVAAKWQHLLIPALEKISVTAASDLRFRIKNEIRSTNT